MDRRGIDGAWVLAFDEYLWNEVYKRLYVRDDRGEIRWADDVVRGQGGRRQAMAPRNEERHYA